MPAASFIRPFAFVPYALVLLTLLWSTGVVARSETYEGNLIPNSRESPISIVLQMEDAGGFLTGTVKVGAPLNGNAEIHNGRNVAGSCNLNTVLSNYVTLRLYGSCGTTVFEGYYTIYYTQSRTLARGTFRILRKVRLADRNIDGIAPPAATMSACLKTNTRCLAACPRGDTDIEYLCSNRCRAKLQTCKTQVKQAATDEGK